MNELILNGKSYLLSWPSKSPDKIDWTPLTPYEAKVLQFCQRWLSGQDSFTLNSSGSTGPPKAISLSRNQMQVSARLTGRALGLQPGDRALVCLSTEYIAGMMMLVRGFELGLRLTIITPSSNPLADFPADTHFDFTALVPLQLQQILTGTTDKCAILNRMKAILIGGAPVSLALWDQLQRIAAPIYHTYGMTETATHVALRRLNGPQASQAYTPLAGVQVGLDHRGCLTINSAVTNGKIVHTNDLAQLNPDGTFTWLGRIDHVINTGGLKVQIEKVEEALEATLYQLRNGALAGRRFFVGPVDHPRLGQAVAAVIEGEPFSAEIETEVRTALLQSLDKYELPRQFHFVPRLLETPTRKIDRRANLDHLAEAAIDA